LDFLKANLVELLKYIYLQEVEKMESILEWMRATERRFSRSSGSNSNQKAVNTEDQPNKLKSLDTLDKYLNTNQPETGLFDETFGPSDFKLLTKRWKEEQVAVQSE
jgi:hypothetical protein